MGYRDALKKRNDEVMDAVLDMQDDIETLCEENEYLDNVNQVVIEENEVISEHNEEMREGIKQLHKDSRGYRGRGLWYKRRGEEPMYVEKQLSNAERPYQKEEKKNEDIKNVALSLSIKEVTKNRISIGMVTICLILMGLDVNPSTQFGYETFVDMWIKLICDPYNVGIFIIFFVAINRIWKKLNNK